MESALTVRQGSLSVFIFRTLFSPVTSQILPIHQITIHSNRSNNARRLCGILSGNRQLLVLVDGAAGPKRKGLDGNIFSCRPMSGLLFLVNLVLNRCADSMPGWGDV